jgi:hypothetical protein
MVAAGRRITTWVLLTSYLFLLTAAHFFHQHRPDACGHDEDQDRTVAVLDGDGSIVKGQERVADSAGHGCVICQFLSQKVAPGRPVEAFRAEVLRESAIAASPAAPARPALLLERTRAPPLVA